MSLGPSSLFHGFASLESRNQEPKSLWKAFGTSAFCQRKAYNLSRSQCFWVVAGLCSYCTSAAWWCFRNKKARWLLYICCHGLGIIREVFVTCSDLFCHLDRLWVVERLQKEKTSKIAELRQKALSRVEEKVNATCLQCEWNPAFLNHFSCTIHLTFTETGRTGNEWFHLTAGACTLSSSHMSLVVVVYHDAC